MVQKRGRLELIYDILNVIRTKGKEDKIKPTPLLRFANLSTQRFEKYVKELEDKNFIEQTTDGKGKKQRKVIKITEEGHRYLEKYQAIKDFIEDFDL